MKAASILIGVLIVFSFTLVPGNASALTPGETPLTCSGDGAFFGSQNFFFGVKDKHSCGVQAFYANSEKEAWGCALQLCPNCSLEDITSLFQFHTPDSGDPKEVFCRKK